MTALTYDASEGIARIALAARPVNAITLPLLDELLAALRKAGQDDTVRVVIIESAIPRFFCAGLDLAVLQDQPLEAIKAVLERLYTGLLDAQFALGKPSIAAVSGAARGGGMTLAVSCSMIVADQDASFGYPEINVAMPPAIHLAHLPKTVGRHRAYELLFTGRPFGPAEALEMGLASRLASGSAAEEALHLARNLAAKSPAALRAAHSAFMAENDHRGSVQRAIDLFCEEAVSADAREGVRAFVEKRPPVWRA